MVKHSMVRLRGTDIPGELPLERALLKIKGIGWNFSRALCVILKRELGIERNTPIGDLEEGQLQKIEEIILNAHQYLPKWMLNRPSDPFTGEARHYTGTDLDIIVKQDIEFHKKILDYRGWRHRQGLPVRGQRTRSSFRGRKKHRVKG